MLGNCINTECTNQEELVEKVIIWIRVVCCFAVGKLEVKVSSEVKST